MTPADRSPPSGFASRPFRPGALAGVALPAWADALGPSAGEASEVPSARGAGALPAPLGGLSGPPGLVPLGLAAVPA